MHLPAVSGASARPLGTDARLDACATISCTARAAQSLCFNDRYLHSPCASGAGTLLWSDSVHLNAGYATLTICSHDPVRIRFALECREGTHEVARARSIHSYICGFALRFGRKESTGQSPVPGLPSPRGSPLCGRRPVMASGSESEGRTSTE